MPRRSTAIAVAFALVAGAAMASPIVAEPCCPADLDRNGTVDAVDLGIALGVFGSGASLGDVDADGDVDAADVALLLEAWGACPELPADPGRIFGTYQLDLDAPGALGDMDVRLADVDHDADADVVVVGSEANLLIVVRRECDGSFASPETYAMGSGPSALVLGDVDGDGSLDAVASCIVGDDVVVRHGAPDGTFGSASSYPIGDRPIALALADLNGDRLLDVLAANDVAQNAVARLNVAGGGFGPPSTIASGFQPKSLAAADLDGDGDVDVAVASSTGNEVRTFLNGGDATFIPGATLAAATGLRRVVATDVDADGDLDLVAACANTNASPDVLVFANDGRGQFSPGTGYGVLPNTALLTTADLDDDGDPDLVAATTSFVSTLLNDGAGAFRAGASVAGGGPVHAIGAADADGDGDADVFTAALGATHPMIGFLPNDGAGALGEVTSLIVGGDPYSGAAGDLDRDGDLDLVVGDAAFQNEGVIVLRNLGEGSFETWQSYPTPHVPISMSLADLDSDRDEDLIVLLLGGGAEIRWNNGQGVCAESTTIPLPISAISFCVRDLDADRDLDVAIAALGGGNAVLLFNDGHGAFGPAVTYAMNGLQQKAIVCDDLNGDGAPDLVVASGSVYHESKLTMRWNDGTGRFGPLLTVAMPLWIIGVVAGDLDHDGDLDIVATNESQTGGPGTIAVRLNDGAGSLGTPTIYPALAYPHSAVLRDVDEDGSLDLVVCNDDVVSVRFGVGDGSFGRLYSYVAGLKPWQAIVEDFDGDGDVDIATPNYGGVDAAVRWNRLVP